MARPFTKKEREEKKKLFLEAYDESKGMTTTSCQRAGISRETLSNWKESDPDFAEACEDIRQKWIEWVQGRLMTMIENGNVSATVFFLKCKGGFQEKVDQHIEVEQKGQIDIKAEIERLREELKGTDE